MAVFKRGDRWCVTVHDRGVKGAKRWVGTFADKEDAKDAEFKARKGARRSSRVDAGQFASEWVDRYPRTEESTNIGNRERISKFVEDFRGRPLGEIERVEARAWALANRSRLQAARAMFSDAVRDGLVESNPFANLRLKEPDGRKHLVVPTDNELGEMAQAAAKVQGEWGRVVLGPFIMFAAYTGLRPGEMYAVRWEDIDLRGSTVRVEWQWSQTERKLKRPKYDSRRTIFLPLAAREAVEQLARVRDSLFSAPRGGRLTGASLGHYWGPVVRSVGRPDLTPHCMRHYYGTLLARKGVAPYEIAKSMGHKDGGKLAMERYIHVTERDAREKIAAAFGSNVRDLRVASEASTGANHP